MVIPTYNRSLSLRRCLAALAGSDLQGVEADIVVADDGSPDNTAETVRDFAAKQVGGLSFRHLRQQNQGPSAARNLGIAAAETELVLFTDDDCAPKPDWIRTLARSPRTEDTGGIGGRIQCGESRTWVSRYCRYMGYNEYPSSHRPWNFLNTANCAYPRRVLQEVGGFIEGLRGGEDIELSWRVLAAGYRLRYQPRAVVDHFHREDLGSLLRTFRSRGYNGVRRSLLWGNEEAGDPSRERRERAAQLRWAFGALMLLPTALKLLIRGVRPADALPFALVDWLRPGYNRAGRLAMLEELRLGRTRVEWPAEIPRQSGAPDPARPEEITANGP